MINVYIEICLTAEDIEILNFLAAAVGDRLSTFFEEAPKGYAPNLVLTEIMKKKQLFTHFGKYIRGEKAGMELAKVYTTYIRLYASLPEQSKGRAVLAKIITFFQALVTQDRIAATMLQVGEDLRNSFLSQET